MKTQHTHKSIRKIFIVIVMAIAEFALAPAQAQDFRQRNYNRGGTSKPMAAVTLGVGTRSSFIKSDLDYINGLKGSLGGWESSLMVGGDHVRLRTGFGFFKTSLSDVNSIKQSSINGLVNIYVPGMKKNFRPYVITGVDVNIFRFSGSYIPKSRLLITNPVQACVCQLSAIPVAPEMPLPPPNPGLDSEEVAMAMAVQADEAEPAAPEVNSAKMTSTQLVSGLGSEYNFRLNGRFFSMFGEMRYGLPIGVTTQTASMSETNVKNNVALTFGVAMGLHSKHKVRKSSIR
jgi:hypothetical protein